MAQMSQVTVADLMRVRSTGFSRTQPTRHKALFVSSHSAEDRLSDLAADFADFTGLLQHDQSHRSGDAGPAERLSVFSINIGQRRLSLARTERSPYLEKQGMVECRPGECPGQLDIVLGSHWKLSLGPA